jgi:hypothetical protein
MNICLAFYPIMDMGGLTNNNNNLCAGLQELGHTTHTVVLLYRQDKPTNGVAGGRGTFCPYSGLEHDQMRGYSWPNYRCVPYKGRALKAAITYLNTFDLIIWQIPCPTKKKENYGNLEWVDLYRFVETPQVAYIHDGNFVDGYPWLSIVAPYLKGVGCVNHAALNSALQLTCKFSLTPSPQDMSVITNNIDRSYYEKRKNGFLSLQTFKAWKHVPELVAAMPYMGLDTKKYLAGKGIDYHYLNSKTKCKWPGIWNAAEERGMEYLGVISNEHRNSILDKLTCLVDPSWSRKYATIGGHYNRVTVEAIMRGALPIVRPLGISTNEEGIGEVFQIGKNCLGIPQNVSPQEYGQMVDHYCYLPYTEYLPIIEEGRKLLGKWDRKTVAQTFLDLAEGRSEHEGITSKKVHLATAEAIGDFFSGD